MRETGSGKGILKEDDWLEELLWVFIVGAAQLVSLWLWGVSPCAARQTSARTKESSQSQQGKPVAGQAGRVGSAQTPVARKSLEQSRLPHPANAPAQGVHRAARGGTCAFLDQLHVQPHLCTLHQHKPSAASFADESCPVSRAGRLGHRQGKCEPRVLPSENTGKKAVILTSACIQTCNLKNK